VGLKQRIAVFVARIQRLKVVRVLTRYGRDRGPILASGMAYQALFAVFAALWVAFSIAGLVVSGNTALQDAILAVLRDAVPGLIKDAAGDGAIEKATHSAANTANSAWYAIPLARMGPRSRP
jgi:membrane protein